MLPLAFPDNKFDEYFSKNKVKNLKSIRSI